ncbi:hypothetical protein BaRGS_00020640 [Batillaria attramentaria]|uniref:Caffeoyl-CoA O-methyltransferase n=1 Tax=Batillaria attramentaria TaxID=370345 RepID=A0ABD0KLN9_9CAEN
MSEEPKPKSAPPRHRDPAIREIYKTLEVAERTKADPEVIEGLKRALQYEDLRDDYALRCSSAQSDACRQIAELTYSHPWQELKEQGTVQYNFPPRMLSGPLEGQVLKSLVSIQRARRVLDVGMFTGYSALSMAEALPEDGVVVTLDRTPYLEQLNKKSFAASPHGSKIQIRIGPALDSMKDLLEKGEKFDFIFLDADKSEYIDYMKIGFEDGLLAENGTVAVDNAFRGGQGYLPHDGPPNSTQLFAEYVINDKSLHKVLLPVRDGVLLIRRLSVVEGGVSKKE